MSIDAKLRDHRRDLKRRLVLSSSAWAAWMSTCGAADNAPVLQEIVVTATRQEQALSDVPVSVAAFTQEQMDAQGLKEFDDVVRYTPGLNFERVLSTGANTIAIRGISSGAGSGTTGIYIDDTPIQVRSLGFGAGAAFPGFFDLERVEVLRGPQGTLFGAGSEGGTVRFIQNQPSLSDYNTYARAEVAGTRNGEPSYEAGAAFGGPILEDRLGFRVSAFHRREGGFVDLVNGNYTVVDPSGESYGDSVHFQRTGVEAEDTNWITTTAFRAALRFAVTDSLTVTPSVSYQKTHVHDGYAGYWVSMSDEGSRDYARPVYHAGDPDTDASLTELRAPDRESGDDEFYLPALAVDWDFGSVQLVSSTSYFDRDKVQWYDYTRGYLQFYMQALFEPGQPLYNGGGTYPFPGQKGMSNYSDSQQNLVQEVRLQSTDSNSRLTWVAGAFYARNKQKAWQDIMVNFLQRSPYIGFEPEFAGYTDGPPYGPGSSAFENFLGIPLGPNSTDYTADWQTIEEQVAGFAQVDFKITEKVKVTAGVRVSENELKYKAEFGGPETNSNAPFGFPCVPGTYCESDADFVEPGSVPVGTGVFAPVFPNSTADSRESAVTPKFGISYTLDDDNMLYATAAKGFRPGGASLQIPTVCNEELEQFGYVNAAGDPEQKLTYSSDSVWSYELGSKNRLFGGRLTVDGSVYHIKWSDIQSQVYFPNCGYDFVDNLANATSEGFDFGFQVAPFDGLTLTGAVGYNKTTFDKDALSPGGIVIYREGSSLPNVSAPWNYSLSAQYDFEIASRETYARLDWTRTSEERPYGNLDPVAPNYNPLLSPVPAYNVLNARIGLSLAGADISVFVENVTDENPPLDLDGGGFYDPQDWTNVTLRPRTYGLTATYRY
jgi:iron complex outermembrane recepter protein